MAPRQTDSIWERFFDGQAPAYMDNVFTKGTEEEVRFLIEELALPEGSAVLDVGCGTGRHAVGLGAHGYKVTGVDISSGMLEQAREAARKAGVSLELVHKDAGRMSFDRQFDAAICLCEGAFGLLGADDDPLEHDLAILRRIHAALKPGAKLILNALSASEKIRRFKKEDIASGRWDPVNLVETFELTNDTSVEKETYTLREKGYVATELRLMLGMVGFEVEHVWAGEAGKWRREPPDPDEIEWMLVAHKTKL